MKARHEDEPGGLVAHGFLQRVALLVRELAWVSADVADEDHVVLRELLVLRKSVEVVLAAADFAEVGLKEERVDLDARVALEGVAQVAIFPARERVDDEHAELFLAHGERRLERVVVEVLFVAGLRDGERELDVARVLRFPHHHVLQAAHRGNDDVLGDDFAGG